MINNIKQIVHELSEFATATIVIGNLPTMDGNVEFAVSTNAAIRASLRKRGLAFVSLKPRKTWNQPLYNLQGYVHLPTYQHYIFEGLKTKLCRVLPLNAARGPVPYAVPLIPQPSTSRHVPALMALPTPSVPTANPSSRKRSAGAIEKRTTKTPRKSTQASTTLSSDGQRQVRDLTAQITILQNQVEQQERVITDQRAQLHRQPQPSTSALVQEVDSLLQREIVPMLSQTLVRVQTLSWTASSYTTPQATYAVPPTTYTLPQTTYTVTPFAPSTGAEASNISTAETETRWEPDGYATALTTTPVQFTDSDSELEETDPLQSVSQSIERLDQYLVETQPVSPPLSPINEQEIAHITTEEDNTRVASPETRSENEVEDGEELHNITLTNL